MSGPVEPGRLRHRLVLEAPREVPDGAGGTLRTFVTVATLAAAIERVRTAPAQDTGRRVPVATWRIVVRATRDLAIGWRLCRGPMRLRIVAIEDADGAGRFLTLTAEEEAP